MKSQDLNHAILQVLRSNVKPMGSWGLYYILRDRGYGVSAPTIGRRLRDLEQTNLVTKVTVEGRSITPSGERVLREGLDDHRIRTSAQKFLQMLKSKSRKDIIDQLMIRRIIEDESAGLAALNASRASIVNLEKIVQRQKQSIAKGAMGVKEDVGFHENLAKASGNRILVPIVHLLRSQKWMNYALVAIRARVGTRLVIDHEEIISAIKDHNAAAARMAMHRHITKVIQDVEQYWERVLQPVKQP
jgi:GntR family transcriptional regulator, transcriptional repressor for pyruvate dehydrogenase complex